MDYKNNIKELQVYSYFNQDTISEIVEWYHSAGGTMALPNNISKKEAIEALMDWLQDNCAAWNFGADVAHTVAYLQETVSAEKIEDVLEMKKASDILEEMYS